MVGERGKGGNLNMDVNRFPGETPLSFPRSDGKVGNNNLGYIITIIGT